MGKDGKSVFTAFLVSLLFPLIVGFQILSIVQKKKKSAKLALSVFTILFLGGKIQLSVVVHEVFVVKYEGMFLI